MAKQRFTIEEIIHRPREADVLIGQWRTFDEACKQIGISDETIFGGVRARGFED